MGFRGYGRTRRKNLIPSSGSNWTGLICDRAFVHEPVTSLASSNLHPVPDQETVSIPEFELRTTSSVPRLGTTNNAVASRKPGLVTMLELTRVALDQTPRLAPSGE